MGVLYFLETNSQMMNPSGKVPSMKKITREKISNFRLAALGLMIMALCSAYLPPRDLPVPAQTGEWLQTGTVFNFPSLPQASSLFSLNTDTITRIAFATGTTSKEMDGNLASQAIKSYILDASWNQVMMVTVNSPDDNAYLEIYGQQDGAYLTRFSSNSTSWKGWLPMTQSYIINVKNTGGSAADYTLTVEIPARIRFARGAYSGSVYGRGSAAKTISYVLYARSGQTMTATLSSSTSSVYLSIEGFSGGQSLVSSSAGDTTWTGTLPQTQEYIVRAVQNSTWVDFSLTARIV
jgi:hypothetical protein